MAMGFPYKQKRSRFWWIRYTGVDGQVHSESSRRTRKKDAISLLQKRTGAIANGIPITPQIDRLTFVEAAEDLAIEYKANQRRSLDELQRRITKHLTPVFGIRRMNTITTADIRKFIAKRQTDTIVLQKARTITRTRGKRKGIEEIPLITKAVSNAEINRELATLKRIFNLAIENEKLHRKPKVPMLKEHNIRTGFFEVDEMRGMLNHLPDPLRPMIRFAYVTGWRIPSEILPLEWRQVDFEARRIRLDPGTTKNDEGRWFPFTDELDKVLKGQWSEHERLKAEGKIVPFVFHRSGKPIKAFIKAWHKARLAAACPGRIPHDLRRTAVRNLIRAGVPERVAMKLTGHKTRSVFDRYNIVSEGDLDEAARKLNGLNSRAQAELVRQV